MKDIVLKRKRLQRRRRGIRKHISGSSNKPRVSVYRSNKHIFAQIIDDAKGTTIASKGDIHVKKAIVKKDSAKKVGLELGKAAISKKVKDVVFDRSGYKYHGRVKELADGLREAGLKF